MLLANKRGMKRRERIGDGYQKCQACHRASEKKMANQKLCLLLFVGGCLFFFELRVIVVTLRSLID
jgi:hypothetical protein